MGFLGLFFGFRGRINRMQYWIGGIIANLVGSLVTNTGSGLLVISAATERSVAGPMSIGLVLLACALVSLWVSLALTVKRLHDRGRSGWMALLALVPIAGLVWVLASMRLGQTDLAQIARALTPVLMLTALVGLYFLVDLGLLPGVDGPNAHGDKPPGGFMPASTTRWRDMDIDGREPNSLSGAEEAIERAIAQRRNVLPEYRSSSPQPAPRPAHPQARPIVSPAPQGFGRRGLT